MTRTTSFESPYMELPRNFGFDSMNEIRHEYNNVINEFGFFVISKKTGAQGRALNYIQELGDCMGGIEQKHTEVNDFDTKVDLAIMYKKLHCLYKEAALYKPELD